MSDAAVPVNARRRRLTPMDTKEVAQYSDARPLPVSLCVLLLALLVWLAQSYVRLRGPDTDFFPRWHGLRALLLERRDPYAAEVTAEAVAQTSLAAAPEAAQAAYGLVYPLPGVLPLAPLTLLPYEWAGAVWLVVGLIGLPASALLMVRASEATAGGAGAREVTVRRLRYVLAPALAFGFLPVLWNLALVQPGLAVVPLMTLGLCLWQRQSMWAGISLGLAALLKPQLGAPLALASAVFSALRWRRQVERRVLAGILVSAALLSACAALLFPVWPHSWAGALRDYAAIPMMQPLTPGAFGALRLVMPAGVAQVITGCAAVCLMVWVVRGWSAHDLPSSPPIEPGVRTIVVGSLLVPPAWETNALVLLIPLATTLGTLPGRATVGLVAACGALSVILAPLPLLLPWRSGPVALVAYATLWGAARWWSHRAARSAPAPDAA